MKKTNPIAQAVQRTHYTIRLSEFRTAVGNVDDVLAICLKLREAGYGNERIRTFSDTVLRCEIAACDWTNDLFEAATRTDFEDSGEIVSPDAFEASGAYCVACEAPLHVRDTERFGYEGSHVCVNCVENNDEITFHDGRYVWRENIANDDDDDNSDDEDEDAAALPRSRDGLGNYSDDVTRVLTPFLSTEGERLPPKPLWLGVELEIEPRETRSADLLRRVSKALDQFVILKPDGSLSNGGFEIVTVPATLACHRERWMPFFDGPASDLRSWTGAQCGMHVHVDRNAFSTLGLGRFIALINESDNEAFITKVAGRYRTEYVHLMPRKVSIVKTAERVLGHYEAANVSSHTQGRTVELRIFRGNASPLGFHKNLDFTHGLVSYCNQASIRSLDARDFVTWMDQPPQHAAYPYFASWAAREHVFVPRVRSLRRAIQGMALQAA